MLQNLYLRFPRGWRFSSLNLAARHGVKYCRIYTWGSPRLAFIQPELSRETRGEMLQDLYLRFPRGWRFSSLNLAARLVVKCCRIYTWDSPRLAFIQPELSRETSGKMLQDLYLRFPRGWRFSSLNLAVRHVVKCCRIYTWGCPPTGVSLAWNRQRDTWLNAAGSIPGVPPRLAFPQPELGCETLGEMLQDLYLRFPPGWRFSSLNLTGRHFLNLAVRHMVKWCRIYTWGSPPADVSPAWTWLWDTWWNAAGSIPEVAFRLAFLQPELGRETRGEMLQDLILLLRESEAAHRAVVQRLCVNSNGITVAEEWVWIYVPDPDLHWHLALRDPDQEASKLIKDLFSFYFPPITTSL